MDTASNVTACVDEFWSRCESATGNIVAVPKSEVAMDWKQYITADPTVLHGAVCFAGTRIPVTVVLDNLADSVAPADILHQYPGLSSEHIRAALGYAAELARERVVPILA